MTTEKPDEQIDAEAVAERKLRNDAGERAEDAARQQSTGALPQTLPTLKYLPVERAQLARQRDDGMTTRYGVGRATHEPVVDPLTALPIPPAA